MSGGTSPAHAGSECLFAALARRSPDAIVLQGTRQTWRAAELLSAVDDLAARIAGTRVLAVLAGNGPAWVIADLAALRAGTVHLPLPDFFSQAQLAHAVEQTGADSVLTDQPERIARLNRGFAVVGKWNGLLLLQRLTEPVDLPPGTAKISFTSGSTGAPKGACLSAVGLMETASAVARRLAALPIDRHLAVLPLSLLLENSAGIYAPLLRAAEICMSRICRPWAGKAWPASMPAALQRGGGDCREAPASLILVPELLKAWSAAAWRAAGKRAAGRPALCRGRRRPRLAGPAGPGARTGAAGLSGLRPDRGRFGGQPQSPRRRGWRGRRCRSAPRPRPDAHRRAAKSFVGTARPFLGYRRRRSELRPVSGPGGQAGVRHRRPGPGSTADGHLRLAGRRKNLLITSFGRNIAPEWVESDPAGRDRQSARRW
jgi:long-chain acyl-CoA synthetase